MRVLSLGFILFIAATVGWAAPSKTAAPAPPPVKVSPKESAKAAPVPDAVVPVASTVPAVPSVKPAPPVDSVDRFLPQQGSERISALEFSPTWKMSAVFVTSEGTGPRNPSHCRVTFTAQGKFSGKYDKLVLNNRKIVKRNDKDEFDISLELTVPDTQLQWLLIGPTGEVAKQTSLVHVGMWTDRCKETILPKVYRRFMSVGVGITALAIQDSRQASLTQLMVTPKIGFFYPFKKPRWDLGANMFVNAAPLWRSRAVTARFLGVNGRFGIVLPWNNTPWKIRLLIGAYYTTMFVNPQELGFTNISGPQIYPAFSYALKNQHLIGAYFKFSPVSDRFSFLNFFTSREIALGVSYSLPAKKGKRPIMSVTLDFSSLNAVLSGVNVNTQSLTIGTGVSI